MLECQKETENKDVFLCEKMIEKIGYEDYKVHKGQCSICSNNQKQFLASLEKSFYLSVLHREDLNKYLDKAKKYVLENEQFIKFLINNIIKIKIQVELISSELDKYFLDNVNNIGIEDCLKFLHDEEAVYTYWKNGILTRHEVDAYSIEVSLKHSLRMLLLKKDFVIRLIKEEKDRFSSEFLEEIEQCIQDQDINIQKKIDDPTYILKMKISLLDKIKGAKLAFKRIKQQSETEGKESLWVSDREATERQVCCSVCTDGTSCPYCGCQIKKSWFLPLGKSELTTEGCPNPNTYPHLKNFPPKNYWEVCKQKTVILAFITEDNKNEISFILQKMIDNAMGEIEILVGTNIEIDISINNFKNVLFIKEANNVEDLKQYAEGDYLFLLEQCNYEDMGYDTKLKCEFL